MVVMRLTASHVLQAIFFAIMAIALLRDIDVMNLMIVETIVMRSAVVVIRILSLSAKMAHVFEQSLDAMAFQIVLMAAMNGLARHRHRLQLNDQVQ